MEFRNIDIALAILDFLKDGEYHSIMATTLGVGKYLHLSATEMKEIAISWKSDSPTFTKTKIYVQTVIVVSHLRKAKFLKDFPKTSKLGFFSITDKGLDLSQKKKIEIKKIINSELSKYTKN